MERKFKLIPYRVYKYCPKCPGIMEYLSGAFVAAISSTTNSTWATQQYNHKCKSCGHVERYDMIYPRIDYIEDGELEQTNS